VSGAGRELFRADELQRLERLRIRRRRSVRGGSQGEWRSARLGTSGLFADHRAYVAGDDLRYVDWNVYGRLGDLVVKRFEAEENVNLLLCVDRSLSMGGAKAYAARRLAGALGYLALTHMDHVRLAWLPARTNLPLTNYRSRGRARAFLDDLTTTSEGGITDHVRDLGRVVSAAKRRGLAVLISDFFDPAGAIRGLALLRARGLELGAIHIVDPRDADVPVGSSIVAVDRETGEEMAVDVTTALRERIYRAWVGRGHGLERWCVAREIPYLRVDARRNLWEVLQDLLRARVALSA
jgi:uncharacterized protein (DUF58 family)